MNRRESIKKISLGAITPALLSSCHGLSPFSPDENEVNKFETQWKKWPNMEWIGPEFWGNRLQDWIIENGKAVCRVSEPNRNLQILIAQANKLIKPYKIKTQFQILNLNPENPSLNQVGFMIGAKGRFENYQSSAVFGKGLIAGVNMDGFPFIGDEVHESKIDLNNPIDLQLEVVPKEDQFKILLSISPSTSKEIELSFESKKTYSNEEVTGNLALYSHFEKSEMPSVSFSFFTLEGEKLTIRPSQTFGPICFAQYTLHNNILKLNAQLAPLEKIEGHKAELQFFRENWNTEQAVTIHPMARIAAFRIENFSEEKDLKYRIKLTIPLATKTEEYFYEGTIHIAPSNLNNLKTAVFSCNADHGFPDQEIPENVLKHKPDLALFLGDQFYESTGGYGVQTSPLEMATLDYLRKWLMFGWSYREIFRHVPSAFIPDDHDVYHGNVWGEAGKHADTSEGWGYVAQDKGGYKMPSEWVNMVQLSQTSHLPDAVDPTPVLQGIGVYFTNLTFGGVSFAILEDRKFKSAPKNVLPLEAEVVNGFIQNPEFDIKKHRDIDAELLGKRQLDFLNTWAKDWSNGAKMKVVLSQTNFCTVATLPKGSIIDEIVPQLPIPKKGEYVQGDEPTRDMDSNGWPQKGRDEALKTIRKCFAFHIAGDQHLASIVRYGVDEFEDSGFAFSGPALNNLWPRRWWPSVSKEHVAHDKQPPYTGDFEDGFGNKISVYAVANPRFTGRDPSRIYDRATGYGMVTFDTTKRNINIECWPRYVNPEQQPDGQYEGWPITISQTENYGRKYTEFLPEISVKGISEPIFDVFNEKNEELIYSFPSPGSIYKPGVFEKGIYSIHIRDANSSKAEIIKNLTTEDVTTIHVDFS